MCKRCSYAETMAAMVARRTVLKLAAAATAGFGFLLHALAQIAKAPPKPENVVSPDAALLGPGFMSACPAGSGPTSAKTRPIRAVSG
jgi:hypothetical protein